MPVTFNSIGWHYLCSTVEGVVYSTPNSTSSVTTEQVEDAEAVGCGILHTLPCIITCYRMLCVMALTTAANVVNIANSTLH